MGQKVHPYGFRLGFNKPWRSRWFAKQGYAKLLQEDLELKAESARPAEVGRRQLHRSRPARQQAAGHHPHVAAGHHHRPQGRGNREAEAGHGQEDQARGLHRHPGSAQAGAGRAAGVGIHRAAARKARGLPPRHAQGRGFGAALRLQGHQGARFRALERRGNRAQRMVPAGAASRCTPCAPTSTTASPKPTPPMA